jgi:ligand-binding sensor domain-containing protein
MKIIQLGLLLVVLLTVVPLSSCNSDNSPTAQPSPIEENDTVAIYTTTPAITHAPSTNVFEATEEPELRPNNEPTHTPTQFNAVRLDSNSPNQVRAMLLDKDGRLWTGGPGEVTRNGGPGVVVRWDFDTGKHKVFTPDEGLPNAFVVSMTQTGDGAIWVGTFGGGIARFDGSNWKIFTTEDGLPTNYIRHVFTQTDGSLWINPYREPLEEGYFGRYDGQHWLPVAGGGWDTIAVAPEGSIWVSDFFGFGISHFAEGTWDENEFNDINITFRNEHIVAISAAHDGMVWVATTKSVYKFSGGNWMQVSVPWTYETSSRVTTINFGTDGAVWFGFSSPLGLLDRCGSREIYQAGEEIGIYRYDGRNWKQFTVKDGLADNKICTMAPGRDGSMWVGTYDNGVSYFDGETWTNYAVTNFEK